MSTNQTTEVNDLMRQLHAELRTLPAADAETRKLLEMLLEDVSRSLAGPERRAAIEHETPLERLSELEREFELRYPVIAGLLGRIADGLSNMGI